MRLSDLFEAPFTPPGISYVLNDPQNNAAVGQNTANAVAQTSNVAPINGSIPATTTGVAPSPNGPQQPNPAAMGLAQQQFQKGSIQSIKMGPNSVPQPMKVTDTSNNNSMVKGPTVTLGNPNNKNQPEQTYPLSTFAKK
jgi:hypothetical protein